MKANYKARNKSDCRRIFRFDNGLGASVVRNKYTYGNEAGLYELAVLRFNGEGIFENEIAYDTPITADVVGWLTESKAQTLLKKIKAL